MTNEKGETHETFLKIFRTSFSPRNLEDSTERFDKMFPGLNLKDLPEYQAAVDAIRLYREIAVQHYEKYGAGKE